MLELDIFLNILKYLDIYQWNEYINMNKKLKNNLLKKLNLIKKYFNKIQYPKLIPLYKFFIGPHNKWILDFDVRLTYDEFIFYRNSYLNKYGKYVSYMKDEDEEIFLIIGNDDFDEEIFLELYRKKGIKNLHSKYSSPYIIAEVPYEYYINGCYEKRIVIKCEICSGCPSVEKYEELILLDDKLRVIKCENKIKILENEIKYIPGYGREYFNAKQHFEKK